MPKDRDPAKRKKQMVLIAVLVVGLIVAVVTQPRPTTSTPRRDDTATYGTATERAGSVHQVSLQPAAVSGSMTDSNRFALRKLSRIDWDQIRTMTLFRARPMEAALAGGPQAAGEPIRVEAIYGNTKPNDPTTANVESDRDSSNDSKLRRSALIGRAIVRPGEALPDGRTVLSVTNEGVAVTP